jgi:hypothetical protein
MNRIYTVHNKRYLIVSARNFKDGHKLRVKLTLLDKDLNELTVKEDSVAVKDYEAKYDFIPKEIADEAGVDSDEIVYVKGWIDSNGDEKEDYSEEVIYKVGVLDIVGIGHLESTNESYLITLQDLKDLEEAVQKDSKLLVNRDYYNFPNNTLEEVDDIQSKARVNPVNEFAKNSLSSDDVLSNFIKGFASVGGYLYAFGDFAARYTGFRDKQQCAQSVIDNLECSYEQDKLQQDILFTKKLTQAIATNEKGLGDVFVKSVNKYISQNKSYFGGRAVGAAVIANRVTDKRIGVEPKIFGKKRNLKLNPAGFPISVSGSYMDVLYYLRNIDTSVSMEEITPEIIDLFAKYIVLGQ